MSRRIALYLSAAIVGFCQTPRPRPEFEVASVRPSPPPSAAEVHIGIRIDGAQVNCTALSLRDYIRIAYRVKDYQISAPDWLASEKFDIAAKLPGGATRGEVPAMLQTLLTDRFQMKLHHDSKEFPVYGLVVAKSGIKMKESQPEDASAAADPGRAPVDVQVVGGRDGTSVNYGHGSNFSLGPGKLEGAKLTMQNLADMLARFLDRPVVDMTGLKGSYDFHFDVPEEEFRIMTIRAAISAGVSLPPQAQRLVDGATDDALFAGLETVGLKLETRKAPLDVLVIDHMEKAPVEN